VLAVDIHEDPKLYQAIKQQVPDAEQMDCNGRGWGDFYFTGQTGSTSLENKQWSEILGYGLSHVESQLMKQSQNADHLGLIVRGFASPGETGTIGWRRAGEWMRQERLFAQNYRGLIKKLAMFQANGVHVYQVAGWEDVANLVVDLYNHAQNPEESKTFNRVIVERPVLTSQYPPEKERLIRQLMGLEAGIGEEIAEAIAKECSTLSDVLDALGAGSDWGQHLNPDLAALPLRSGRRTVGPAAVKRLREAIGC
jgi:hypothetical protein